MSKLFKTVAALALAVAVGGSPVAVRADLYTCTPVEVGVYSNRVHVKCASYALDGTAIWFFAVPTSDTGNSNRFLTTANSALVSGRPLAVLYNAGDTSGAAWGCAADNCRSIWGFLLR